MFTRFFSTLMSLALLLTPALAEVTGFNSHHLAVRGEPYLVFFDGKSAENEVFAFTRPGNSEPVGGLLKNAIASSGRSPIQLEAPRELGDYLIVLMRDGKVVLQIPVQVIDPVVELDAPDVGIPGRWIDVGWKLLIDSPSPHGYIELGKPGEAATAWNALPAKDEPVQVQLPVVEGTYELRYTLGRRVGAPVLGRKIVTVEREAGVAAAVADAGGLVPITVPAQVATGEEFSVGVPSDLKFRERWQTRIVPPGADDSELQRWPGIYSDEIAFNAPLVAGDYEIVMLDWRFLERARVAFSVVEATASVQILEDPDYSANVLVAASGPTGRHNRVAFARPSSPPGEFISFGYLMAEGDTTYVERPTESGDYELRYLQKVEDGWRILAALPYTVP